MQIAKWGNSLAVRLPAALVRKLHLEVGDEIDLIPDATAIASTKIAVKRKPSRREVVDSLKRFAGRLPQGFTFDRDEAHRRG